MGLLDKLGLSWWVRQPRDITEIFNRSAESPCDPPRVVSDDEMEEMLRRNSWDRAEVSMYPDDWIIFGRTAYRRETAVDELIGLASNLAVVIAGLSKSVYFGTKNLGVEAYQKVREAINEKAKNTKNDSRNKSH